MQDSTKRLLKIYQVVNMLRTYKQKRLLKVFTKRYGLKIY